MQASVRTIGLATSVGVFLAAATALSLPRKLAHAGSSGSLEVTVKAGAARRGELPPWAGYKQEADMFDATLRVVNKSDVTRELWVWNCSWPENWQLQGKGIGWAAPPCTRNNVYLVTLKPGEAHEQKVVMFIKEGWPADEVAFRVGFTSSPRPSRGGLRPVEKGPTHWSEDVIVRAPQR